MDKITETKKSTLRRITAKEARALVESSEATLKHIYKYIESEAKENRITLYWGLSGYDDATRNKIINTLTEDGYSVVIVDLEAENSTIKISW